VGWSSAAQMGTDAIASKTSINIFFIGFLP